MTTPVDEDVAALIDDLSQLKVVMIDGRFEAASGFELSADKRVATFKDPAGRDDAHDADATAITLRLSWVDAVGPTSSPSRLR